MIQHSCGMEPLETFFLVYFFLSGGSPEWNSSIPRSWHPLDPQRLSRALAFGTLLLLATSFHSLHCLTGPQTTILRISRSGLLPWRVSIYGRMQGDA